MEIPAFDRVLIESTGLADPYPILSTIRSDPVLCHHFRYGSVIVTVDAANGRHQLESHEESVRQAAAADRLVVTKTDLCEEHETAALIDRLRAINPIAPIVKAMDESLDLGDLARLGDEPGLAEGRVDAEGHGPEHDDHDHASRHGARIRSFAVAIDRPIDWTAFGVWLTMLLNRHGDNVLRVKGILNLEGEPNPVAVHGVQRLVHPPVHMTGWPDADRRSRLVFIVQDLDPGLIRRSLMAFNRICEPSVALA